MKKLAFGILVLCCFGSVAISGEATHHWRSFEDVVALSEPVIESAGEYVTVRLKEATTFLQRPGEPVLPVITREFILPLGSKNIRVDVNFSGGDEVALAKQVRPGPEPVPKTGMRRIGELTQKREIYESRVLYPYDSFDYRVGAGIKREKRGLFLKVNCYPVRYAPALNELHCSQSVGIKVSYDEPAAPISFPDQYDMVIIAPSMFSDELGPLMAHKNSRGVLTTLKTTEEIYAGYPGRDNPEKIKYFIKDAIETWGVSYVLLVGGAAQIPCRYTHIYFEYDYQDYWVFPSDLYYADVYDDSLNFSSWDTNDNDLFAEYNWYGAYDELDLYPDVYLGRLACVNETQVITCVSKIITYETVGAYGQDWFTNLVLIGGDSLPGDEEQVDEGEYVNQAVADTLDQFTPIRVWASNGLLYDAANISDAINEGAGFVFFNGHGSTTVWATHPHESYEWIPPGNYRNYHIDGLSNGGELPIVVSDACYHCQYDVAPNCFGWAFLTNPNGGAIAFLGGTDIDVSYGGEAIVTKGIERLCVIMSTNYEAGDTTLGQLWGHGVNTYLAPVMDEIDYITMEEFEPFGDPSLVIGGDSRRPDRPDAPQGETEGVAGEEYSYRSSTTDPDGDSLYYMFDWGDESFSEWLGLYPSGDTAAATHQWSGRGTYEIRVVAKDQHGLHSAWSDPLTVDICIARGDVNDDGVLDVADVIYLLNCLFKSGPPPNPLIVGDCNCSGAVELGDVVFLLNYLFKAGPLPCC